MSKKEWGRYHDLLFLFLSMAQIDGALKVSEREQLLESLWQWRPEMTRAEFAGLFKDVARRLSTFENTIALLKAVEKRSAGLAKSVGSNKERALRLLGNLRDIAQTDGPINPQEQAVLQAVVQQLGLGKRVAVHYAHGQASFGRPA